MLTDTPGVLPRPDGMRNKMERLTIAALAYLPVRVLFVMDLSGRSGTAIADQIKIRRANARITSLLATSEAG